MKQHPLIEELRAEIEGQVELEVSTKSDLLRLLHLFEAWIARRRMLNEGNLAILQQHFIQSIGSTIHRLRKGRVNRRAYDG